MRRIAAVVLMMATVALPAVLLPAAISWRVQVSLHRSLAADTATVRLVGGPIAAFTGQFARLRFRLQRARVDGLVVDDLSGDFSGVDIDSRLAWRSGQLEVRDLRAGRATLRVLEADLARYLEQKGIRSPRVRLEGGGLGLEGSVTLLNTPVDVKLQSRLAVRDDREVVLIAQRLTIGGVRMPDEVAAALLTPVNPLLTVEHLPVPVRFREITAEHGILTLTAESSS